MSMQVSSVAEPTGLSNAAQRRATFFEHLVHLATQTTAPEWVQPLRQQAIAHLQQQTFPTTRDEAWRFTDLSDLVSLALERGGDRHSAVNVDSVSPFTLVEARVRLVFVNGVYAPERSILTTPPLGVTIKSLTSLTATEQQQIQPYLGNQSGSEELFTALNTAGFSDGAIILVGRDQVVPTPIHLLFLSTTQPTPTLIQPRCLVVAAPNSAITLIEEHGAVGDGSYFTNSVTEIWVQENAQVNHTRVQMDNSHAFHIGKTAVSQARDSRYTSHAINLGSRLSRHHLEVYQRGEQTQTTLHGLTLLQGDQVGDTHSAIALTQPYGTSQQLHKCVVDDRAHAIFNGRVVVPQAAQHTNAGQLNRNLLLSPKARVDTKPQLEIVADNVKCTHGATVGQLDTDELFYLQSRGIDAASARTLLIYAFAYEVLDHIPVQSLKQQLAQFVATR